MILPLQAIAFQLLFLIMAIAIEGFILHYQLKFQRKTSIEYATTLNLIAAILGWITFFIIQRFIPNPWRSEMISYIFFDHLITPHELSFYIPIVFTTFFIFLTSFLIKYKGLEILQIYLGVPRQNIPDIPQRNAPRLNENISVNINNHPRFQIFQAILWANACSHTAILVVLILRAFLQAQKNLLFTL